MKRKPVTLEFDEVELLTAEDYVIFTQYGGHDGCKDELVGRAAHKLAEMIVDGAGVETRWSTDFGCQEMRVRASVLVPRRPKR